MTKNDTQPIKVIVSPNRKVLILKGNIQYYTMPIDASSEFNACLRHFGATKITSTDGGQGFVVDFAEPYSDEAVQVIKAVWASLVEDEVEEVVR
jgi:hypothetical protein